jgi:Flp pilus assembly protein TadG
VSARRCCFGRADPRPAQEARPQGVGRARRGGPAPGQVLVIFAAALPALFGFLGLALDGGYYLTAAQVAQFTARTAARAAAVDVQVGNYGTATASGQALGQQNLASFRLAGVTTTIAYNNTVDAVASSPGWYSTTPSAQTSSILATVSGTYAPLFLPFVGISSVGLQQVSVVHLARTVPPTILPIAVCKPTVLAMDTNPTTPQVIWQFNASLCGISAWDGLISLSSGGSGCSTYQGWILPQPSAPPPPLGSALTLNKQNCQNTDDWLSGSAYYAANPIQPILVVDVRAGSLTGTVLCYRQMRLSVGDNVITATPVTSTGAACELQEIY